MRPRAENEWSRLRRVVIGRADSLALPTEELRGAEEGAPLAWWDHIALNRLIRERCAVELDGLERVLESREVEVLRPERIRPGKNETAALNQLFVRDAFMVIGREVLAALNLPDSRSKEPRGLSALLTSYQRDFLEVPATAVLDGGDVLVDLPYVYVGVGEARTNEEGAHFLEECLRERLDGPPQVVPVPFRSARPAHLDCCLTLTGPGRGICHRAAFEQGLPLPLADYDLIEVDDETFGELGVNVLMVDQETVVAQSRHRQLHAQLEAQGLEVIAIDFDQHVSLGGGVRCASAPWHREMQNRETHREGAREGSQERAR